MIKVEVLTIFPEIFSGFMQASLIEKAQARGDIRLRLTDIRSFASPPHFHVDDAPYGGGPGMLMKPEPLAAAIESAKQNLPAARVVLLTPTGIPFCQARAEGLSRRAELILICGRYEGIDQRVIDLFVDEEISIGDYVLMGGEVPAMVVIEAVTRLGEAVLGNSASLTTESFMAAAKSRLLEAPQYTRPPEFRGRRVPEILLSGDHAKIAAWRQEQSLALTKKRRPDLLRASAS